MPVSKDVIRDLLPVYSAGEASADTRALVEEYLARDPELRALADAAGRVEMPEPPRADPMRALEMRALNRTRGLLARKSFVLAIALTFTLLPMTTVFEHGKIVFVLARDYPDMGFSLLLNALIAWAVYLDTCRRLRSTGFEGGRPGYSPSLWALIGMAFGVPAMLVAGHWAAGERWPVALPPVFAGLAFALGHLWSRMTRRCAPEG